MVLKNGHESIQAYAQNVTTSGININNYFADMFVSQLDRNTGGKTTPSSRYKGSAKGIPHKELRGYRFVDVFPTNISAIDLDFGSNDAIEEFTVECKYNTGKFLQNLENNVSEYS